MVLQACRSLDDLAKRQLPAVLAPLMSELDSLTKVSGCFSKELNRKELTCSRSRRTTAQTPTLSRSTSFAPNSSSSALSPTARSTTGLPNPLPPNLFATLHLSTTPSPSSSSPSRPSSSSNTHSPTILPPPSPPPPPSLSFPSRPSLPPRPVQQIEQTRRTCRPAARWSRRSFASQDASSTLSRRRTGTSCSRGSRVGSRITPTRTTYSI